MNQNKNYKFIDLFAGAGGLSEGFIRAGFEPIAHIEMDHYACDTLKTRAAYHYLKANNKLSIYEQYLRTKKEKTDGAWLWNQVPYLQPIITQYFIDNKSEIWLLFLIAHSKR